MQQALTAITSVELSEAAHVVERRTPFLRNSSVSVNGVVVVKHSFGDEFRAGQKAGRAGDEFTQYEYDFALPDGDRSVAAHLDVEATALDKIAGLRLALDGREVFREAAHSRRPRVGP